MNVYATEILLSLCVPSINNNSEQNHAKKYCLAFASPYIVFYAM